MSKEIGDSYKRSPKREINFESSSIPTIREGKLSGSSGTREIDFNMSKKEKLHPGITKFGEYKPRQPQRYRLPEKVTRDNFASMLAASFRVSAADANRHFLYFAYLEANTGFDHKATLKNFLQSGGWATFSEEEQQLFMKSFESVKGHKQGEDEKLWEDFHQDPSQELYIQVEAIIPEEDEDEITEEDEDGKSFEREKASFESKYGPLSSLSPSAFLTCLNNLYPVKKQHRRK